MADRETGVGPLSGTTFVIVASRGGAYGPGTPRADFDFQERYLRAVFTQLGVTDHLTFVNAEMTLADVNPALAAFRDLAAESLRTAHRTVRQLAAADVAD